MGEYTARGGFAAGPTNDLILNLKKPVDRRTNQSGNTSFGRFSDRCLDLRRLLGQPTIEIVTFVPVPPSKARADPLYDDRLWQILQQTCDGYDGDVRELVIQQHSMDASHQADDRADIAKLIANYHLERPLVYPVRRNIVIFDDVITTGHHFKAMKAMLSASFPEARYIGIFVARRVPNTVDFQRSRLKTGAACRADQISGGRSSGDCSDGFTTEALKRDAALPRLRRGQ